MHITTQTLKHTQPKAQRVLRGLFSIALVMFFLSFGGLGSMARAQNPNPADWASVQKEARGQTVYWNAWGGSQEINDFIAWLGAQVKTRYGVTVEHVKLSSTADAVNRVVTEKAAGTLEGGAVDLIWINGENFASMKRQGLLFGPWVTKAPSWKYVDVKGKAAVTNDFTVPTDGLEAPWGMAQIVFMYDPQDVPNPPRSMAELFDWAKKNPGRFSFPQPPEFHGTAFLKQALASFSTGAARAQLQKPADEASYKKATAQLWAQMEQLTPALWRKGRAYPQSGPRQIQMLADNEIDIAISYSPNEASNAIAGQKLPARFRTFVLEDGTLGNASFVAIPFNANAKAGAMVLADFIMSPEAQAKMQDPKTWGLSTVLDINALNAKDRGRFDALELGVATLSPAQLGVSLAEPHPSWGAMLEKEWVQRFGVAK